MTSEMRMNLTTKKLLETHMLIVQDARYRGIHADESLIMYLRKMEFMREREAKNHMVTYHIKSRRTYTQLHAKEAARRRERSEKRSGVEWIEEIRGETG